MKMQEEKINSPGEGEEGKAWLGKAIGEANVPYIMVRVRPFTMLSNPKPHPI